MRDCRVAQQSQVLQPNRGRFLSEEPIGFEGERNLYTYYLNNSPIR
jgi:RHS repeat-associated protein